MIRETLMLLRSGARSLEETAQHSRISLEDLRQRLVLLEKEGYVRKVTVEGCSYRSPSSCRSCPGCRSRSCFDDRAAIAYVLTEKGSRVLDRGQSLGQVFF